MKTQTPSFPTLLTPLETNHGTISVVRDDLLAGGTKQRACIPFLLDQVAKGKTSFVYASPFAGFAQVALALCCNELELACRIYSEEDKSAASPGQRHAFTQLAADAGAEIILCESLAEAEARATQDEETHGPQVMKIPLGFSHESFTNHLEVAIRDCWIKILSQRADSASGVERLWLPVGSGTLATAFRKIVPLHVPIHLIDVGVLATTDSRIAKVRSLPNTVYEKCGQEFCDRAESPPPIPSNIHYDAKLWGFIKEKGRPGDLWWNVAR